MKASVNYEQLLAAYWNNLTTALRGVSVGHDLHFLDAWVPEDDATRGVLGVVEAAQDSELESITIELGATTLSRMNSDELCRAAGAYGAARTERRGTSLELQVTFRRRESNLETSPAAAPIGRAHRAVARSPGEVLSTSSSVPETLPPDYASALQDMVTIFSHQGLPVAPDGFELVSVADAGVQLAALIDSDDGHIEKAGFQGGMSEEQSGLLELLCQLIEGRSIQDASDHAVIELECRLRRSHVRRAVPGIVLPENVSAAFESPKRLLRALLRAYRARHGDRRTHNFHAAPASPQWRQLQESERIARIQAAIDSHPSGVGVKVIRLEGLQRFIIEFDPQASRAGRGLLELERHVKATVESTLSLSLESRADQNTLRRLHDRG